MKNLALSATLALTLAACATAPEDIAPAPVSTVGYSGLSCAQLRAEGARVHGELTAAMNRQKRAASNDAAMTAISLFIFWPAMFMVDGGDDAAVAQLKGEANAIRAAAQQKGCVRS